MVCFLACVFKIYSLDDMKYMMPFDLAGFPNCWNVSNYCWKVSLIVERCSQYCYKVSPTVEMILLLLKISPLLEDAFSNWRLRVSLSVSMSEVSSMGLIEVSTSPKLKLWLTQVHTWIFYVGFSKTYCKVFSPPASR